MHHRSINVQFANKQHASLRESVARLDSAGRLQNIDSMSDAHGQEERVEDRAVLRQMLGLEIATELAAPKHPTGADFLAQVQD
eukprot:SAG31_NODE_5207_length_2676_cov_2.051610_4_plen_83_part_00